MQKTEQTINYKHMKPTKKLSGKDNIQNIINELEDIVNNHPYFAFALLAIIIEVFGKCYDSNLDWQHRDSSKKDFKSAIRKCSSLTKYKTIGDDEVYSTLRCGLLHAFLPKDGILLTEDKNDLKNNIIGCKSLYKDVIAAWNQIKIDPSIQNKLTNNVLEIRNTITGTTESFINTIQ